MRFAISGGHLTPALAFVAAATQSKHSLLCFGTQTQSAASIHPESQEMKRYQVTYVTLPEWKFDRHHPHRLITRLSSGVKACWQCLRHLQAFKPHAVLVFGGYVSIPVALAAKLLRLPLILHDQTIHPGLSSQIIARFSHQAFTSYQAAASHLGSDTIVLSPLLRPEFLRPTKRPSWYPASQPLPLLIVTGGHLGSRTLNLALASIYQALLPDFFIVHQTGTSGDAQTATHCRRQQRTLSPLLQSRLIIKPWLSSQDIAWVFQHASLAVCRAGANTVAEISYSRLPALLVPLPHAINQEQYWQAKQLVAQKTALMLLEPYTPDHLLTAIRHLASQASAYRRQYSQSQSQPKISTADQLLQFTESRYGST